MGYLLGRWRDVDIEVLSIVTIYILLPALVFHSLVTMPISVTTALSLVVAIVGFTATMAAIATIVAWLGGETGGTLSGATLTAAFPNVGNFGIPVATFVFGEIGRTAAVVFVVVQTVLMYTLGVYVLSRMGAAGDRAAAGKRVLTLPVTYAVGAAGAVMAFDIVPPTNSRFMQTVQMLGDAAIPLFLLILGLQLANMKPSSVAGRVLPIAGVKLLAAPVVAVAVALVAEIADPVATRAFILLAAGPAAVTPLVLAIEFADNSGDALSPADYIGTVVVVTILGCVPVLTALIYFLQAGAFG